MKKVLKSLLCALSLATLVGCGPLPFISSGSATPGPMTSFNGSASGINYDINKKGI